MQLENQSVIPGDSDQARAYRTALVCEVGEEIRSRMVLGAMAQVPRHLFVPKASISLAYANTALAIGYEQTISEPQVVALMTEALDLDGRQRVLEIGTGSGYQAAVASLLASEVFSIEVVPELAQEAAARLRRLGYANVSVRQGDGYRGWPERAPFDRILLTAAPEQVPLALFDQLAEGGILVAPVGQQGTLQRLERYRKMGAEIARDDLGGVFFVPMVHAV